MAPLSSKGVDLMVAYSDGRSWSGGYLYGTTVLLCLKGNGKTIIDIRYLSWSAAGRDTRNRGGTVKRQF